MGHSGGGTGVDFDHVPQNRSRVVGTVLRLGQEARFDAALVMVPCRTPHGSGDGHENASQLNLLIFIYKAWVSRQFRNRIGK